MPVFAYSIAADQDRLSEGDGFVRAETIRAAVALIGHLDVNVDPLPADAVWPGEAGEDVWRCGSAVKSHGRRTRPHTHSGCARMKCRSAIRSSRA
jgi:hypothetical protein